MMILGEGLTIGCCCCCWEEGLLVMEGTDTDLGTATFPFVTGWDDN